MHRSFLSDRQQLKIEQPGIFFFFRKSDRHSRQIGDKKDSLDFFVESVNRTNTGDGKSKLRFVFMFSWMSKPSREKHADVNLSTRFFL